LTVSKTTAKRES